MSPALKIVVIKEIIIRELIRGPVMTRLLSH